MFHHGKDLAVVRETIGEFGKSETHISKKIYRKIGENRKRGKRGQGISAGIC